MQTIIVAGRFPWENGERQIRIYIRVLFKRMANTYGVLLLTSTT